MDDGAERTVARDGADDVGEGLAVGDVTADDGGPGAVRGEFGDEFGGSRGVRSAARREQEVPDAVAGDEVAGRGRTDRAGAAGDEDGPVRVEVRDHGP